MFCSIGVVRGHLDRLQKRWLLMSLNCCDHSSDSNDIRIIGPDECIKLCPAVGCVYVTKIELSFLVLSSFAVVLSMFFLVCIVPVRLLNELMRPFCHLAAVDMIRPSPLRRS